MQVGARDWCIESDCVLALSFWCVGSGRREVPDDGVPVARRGEKVSRVLGPAVRGQAGECMHCGLFLHAPSPCAGRRTPCSTKEECVSRRESANLPHSSHSLDMSLKPPHNSSRLEIQHCHHTIVPSYRQEVTSKSSSRIEPSTKCVGID